LFGEWYQKTNKKRYKQINYIGFENGPYPSQYTLATPKIYFFLGVFAHFWGPSANPPTIFKGPNSNFTMGELVLLRRLPNSNFNPRAFAHFWGSGAQNQISLCQKF
jgi:hypothetical protein